ncbi:MAG: hypothetical protein P8J20_08285 [Novosphingobium sp.]|nr:hypothetical protein [Novosphingobium sp.]
MDNLRGQFPDHDGPDDCQDNDDLNEDETGREAPPAIIGQDERRMQVRAYNFWASLLQDRSFPAIESLVPNSLPDFGPYSVLLDFTGGIDNPGISFLGKALADECGTNDALESLSDVPSRSLLSRITDHYMQILANQAPIGFEAEFVNQRGATILYRGILLPFSSDDETIDFIYGVINWKELADQQTTDELMLQIDQALDTGPRSEPDDVPLTEWADGPADLSKISIGSDLPTPHFGQDYDDQSESDISDQPAVEEAVPQMGLADWLASARELAQLARDSEDRSRRALYAAISRAYDFAIAAGDAPEEFSEMIADAGLAVQQRAPMTPLIKLVFGADYDKTRLTEYATVLGHASRKHLARGELAEYLAGAPGGLKGIVSEERQLRRAASGKQKVTRDAPRKKIARSLRKLNTRTLAEFSGEGSEFALLVARRLPDGEIVLLGEISNDVPLIERAAKHLID